jgi:signal transduction histidine kinase
VLIRIENSSLLLEISDNGKGLPAEHHAGIGLHSMRERAAELGGEFVVKNKPSGGTTVRARLPILELPTSDNNAESDCTSYEGRIEYDHQI